MSIRKIAAFAVAAIACVLAFSTIAIFRDGQGGLLAIIGGIAAVGAGVLFVFAARLWARQPDATSIRPGATRFSAGQRAGLVLLALLALGSGVHELVTGKSDPARGPVAYRERQPSEFWQAVILQIGTGMVLLYLGLRRQPTQRGGAAGGSKRSRT